MIKIVIHQFIKKQKRFYCESKKSGELRRVVHRTALVYCMRDDPKKNISCLRYMATSVTFLLNNNNNNKIIII